MRFRSMFFVPMNKFRKPIYKRFAPKADCIILDLEDALPEKEKAQGRADLGEALELFKDHPNVFVRVNNDLFLHQELELLRELNHRRIVLPKFDGTSSYRFRTWEYDIIPIVETCRGVIDASESLKQITRPYGVIFGAEDLSADIGIDPIPEAMLPFVMQTVSACVATGNYCVGYASDFTSLSLNDLKENCTRSKSLGIKGAFCIHPTHLEAINEIYTVEAFKADQHTGVTSENGKMIGPPTLKRMQNR